MHEKAESILQDFTEALTSSPDLCPADWDTYHAHMIAIVLPAIEQDCNEALSASARLDIISRVCNLIPILRQIARRDPNALADDVANEISRTALVCFMQIVPYLGDEQLQARVDRTASSMRYLAKDTGEEGDFNFCIQEVVGHSHDRTHDLRSELYVWIGGSGPGHLEPVSWKSGHDHRRFVIESGAHGYAELQAAASEPRQPSGASACAVGARCSRTFSNA
jgi:hypothetical protein